MPRWQLSIALAAVALVVTAAAPARADEPWAAGVGDARKQEARRLLESGNSLFLERKYPEALATYQQALTAWDHPAIRFNVVRCLIQLGRPVEAYDNLELALRYGKDPLEESVYEEALGYQKLLQGQIGEVEVSCKQPGVTITLDGQRLLDCPGAQRRRFAPGGHQIVARKAGFVTLTRDLVVLPDAPQAIDVALAPITVLEPIEVRRWPWWKPWALVGASAGVATVGGLLEWRASADYRELDRLVAQQCGTSGCAPGTLPSRAYEVRDRAVTENQLAVGALIAGGVGLAAGAVLLYLDRAHTEIPRVDVAPTAGGASATVSIDF